MTAERYDPLQLLEVAELVELWKVSERSLRRWIANGELASVTMGRRRLVPRIAAEEFQGSRFVGGTGTVGSVIHLDRKG